MWGCFVFDCKRNVLACMSVHGEHVCTCIYVNGSVSRYECMQMILWEGISGWMNLWVCLCVGEWISMQICEHINVK